MGKVIRTEVWDRVGSMKKSPTLAYLVGKLIGHILAIATCFIGLAVLLRWLVGLI